MQTKPTRFIYSHMFHGFLTIVPYDQFTRCQPKKIVFLNQFFKHINYLFKTIKIIFQQPTRTPKQKHAFQ